MKKLSEFLPVGLLVGATLVGAFMFLQTIANPHSSVVDAAGATQTVSSTVTVGNTAPTVTSVILNGAASIVLTANATTAVNVSALVGDTNGCGDISGGTTTILVYRATITSSTCDSTNDNRNCYELSAFTATSSCSSNQVNTTSTFGIYYFANATDASSTNSSTNWQATVKFTDANGATSTADATAQELLTLTALNVTTSSLAYGSVAAGADTGATNQVATTTNAGNATTGLRLSANSTLTSGANTIATSSQEYATSTFTWNSGATSTDLTGSPVTVTGFSLTIPTSTNFVQSPSFWGLGVPGGTPTGTYTGQNLFTSLFVP